MVASGLSLYAGAAVAVGLFAHFSPVVAAWFRVAAAGVILAALYRPAPRSFLGRAGLNAAVYGVTTMVMNMVFYEAIAHVAMGTAVALEFLGPVAVAAWGSRSRRDWAALCLALAGVLVISGVVWSTNWQGIAWSLASGALWAAYIVAGSRIAADAAVSRAAMPVGFLYAGLAGLPLVAWLWPTGSGAPGLPRVEILGLAFGLGMLSAAIPYSLDQVVLRMAGASYFALLQAILPMVAAVVGAVALGQWLSGAEVVGIVLIVAAIVLRSLRTD
ncbi:EamA family transporter [uncultured Corynebacterium sp.]|uniref:EamA family transporter n=1 Tax=uncultured Corynebacterium sp. TaxID=159447 RepID=UPI0025ED6318|nr:EamA family transporter [uncultured Corynebacterium sp.]